MDEGSVTEARVVVRAFDPDMDQACIYSTWRKSMFFGVPRRTDEERKKFREISEAESRALFKIMTREIKEILTKAQVRIACLDYDPFTIIGYCVFTDKRLDWIYVKPDYREKGIGRLLCPKNIETYPEVFTEIGQAILERRKQKEKMNGNRKVYREEKADTGED